MKCAKDPLGGCPECAHVQEGSCFDGTHLYCELFGAWTSLMGGEWRGRAREGRGDWRGIRARKDAGRHGRDAAVGVRQARRGGGGRMTHIGDVETWPTGCTEYEQARKVMEEAQEVWYAVYWDEGEDRVKAECADVIQATCNLLAMLGVEDFAPYMDACLEVQKGRGRL